MRSGSRKDVLADHQVLLDLVASPSITAHILRTNSSIRRHLLTELASIA